MKRTPELLKAGDRVAIVATARKISSAELQPAIRLLESWGLEVMLPKNIYAESNQFAGSDAERASDLQWALDREDAKKIPIIALTANAFDEDVERSLQAGLNAHLSKPLEPAAIFRTLKNLIRNQI